jgi:hypothetical protein
MNYRNLAAKIGAVFYVLWGIYHLPAANSVYKLAEGTSGMVQGRLLQNAFYILFFAISGIVIALGFNWRNDRQGYWMNGILIAFADIPFVLFVLLPGLVPWWPGLTGPLGWPVWVGFVRGGQSRHLSAEADRWRHCAVVMRETAKIMLAMSALGQKRTLRRVQTMSAIPPKADIAEDDWDVRFVPIADSCTATNNFPIRS